MATNFILAILMILLLDCTAVFARSQSDEDAAFLVEVYKTAAFLQSYVDVCRERVPATDGENRQAYAAWQKQNQWETLSPLLPKYEHLRKVFEQERQSARTSVLSLVEKSSIMCKQLPSLMEQPEFNPSLRKGADLNRLAAQLRGQPSDKYSPPSTGVGQKHLVTPPPNRSLPQAQSAPRGSNHVEAVITHTATRMGYGGFTTYIYPAYILFKDGTICNDLNVSPYDLDVRKSQESEPKKWGHWKYIGNSIQIQWNSASKPELWDRQWFRMDPGKKSDRLSGYFKSFMAAGSGAIASMAVNGFTFTPDGHFSASGSAAVINGIYSRSSSTQALTGTYSIDGYSIELRFDDGRVERKGFYYHTPTWVGIGNGSYMTDQK